MSIKLQPKMLTDCRHYPGASQWPACKPFGDIPSLPSGKYTNSSYTRPRQSYVGSYTDIYMVLYLLLLYDVTFFCGCGLWGGGSPEVTASVSPYMATAL